MSPEQLSITLPSTEPPISTQPSHSRSPLRRPHYQNRIISGYWVTVADAVRWTSTLAPSIGERQVLRPSMGSTINLALIRFGIHLAHDGWTGAIFVNKVKFREPEDEPVKESEVDQEYNEVLKNTMVKGGLHEFKWVSIVRNDTIMYYDDCSIKHMYSFAKPLPYDRLTKLATSSNDPLRFSNPL